MKQVPCWANSRTPTPPRLHLTDILDILDILDTWSPYPPSISQFHRCRVDGVALAAAALVRNNEQFLEKLRGAILPAIQLCTHLPGTTLCTHLPHLNHTCNGPPPCQTLESFPSDWGCSSTPHLEVVLLGLASHQQVERRVDVVDTLVARDCVHVDLVLSRIERHSQRSQRALGLTSLVRLNAPGIVVHELARLIDQLDNLMEDVTGKGGSREDTGVDFLLGRKRGYGGEFCWEETGASGNMMRPVNQQQPAPQNLEDGGCGTKYTPAPQDLYDRVLQAPHCRTPQTARPDTPGPHHRICVTPHSGILKTARYNPPRSRARWQVHNAPPRQARPHRRRRRLLRLRRLGAAPPPRPPSHALPPETAAGRTAGRARRAASAGPTQSAQPRAALSCR
eukprot:364733-Chlamydomonas_euryale.AAC.5